MPWRHLRLSPTAQVNKTQQISYKYLHSTVADFHVFCVFLGVKLKVSDVSSVLIAYLDNPDSDPTVSKVQWDILRNCDFF